MEVSTNEFGASFKQFLDQMSAAAPAEEPVFRRRILDHFGGGVKNPPTVAEKFQPDDHANLHVALEKILSEDECSSSVCGVTSAVEYAPVTLSSLLAPARGARRREYFSRLLQECCHPRAPTVHDNRIRRNCAAGISGNCYTSPHTPRTTSS